MGHRYGNQTKALSLALQYMRLKSSRICPGHGSLKSDQLTWKFDVRPHPLCRSYRLRIQFKRSGVPKVTVLKPDINELAQGRKLPHVYPTKPVQLCLYFPADREWTSDQSIAETIVPWAYLWLVYFEHWLATDEWQGGGIHPGEKDTEK
jgi:hypothetical protein